MGKGKRSRVERAEDPLARIHARALELRRSREHHKGCIESIDDKLKLLVEEKKKLENK